MLIKPLHNSFIMPTKGSEHAGAIDLYMPEAGEVGDSPVMVKLGFAAAIPRGYVGLLLPRSSVGAKYGLELNNTCGVIDSDYRGEWMASIRTKSGTHFNWKAGERVLQCVVVACLDVQPKLVEDLDETKRGEGGFGSTGKQ